MYICYRKYSSCSALVVLVSIGLGLTGCGGGGGGGNNSGSTSAADWTAARETPYQGSRLSATGTTTSLCLTIHGGIDFYTSEIYHGGYLVDYHGGGSGSGMTLSATSTQLGGLSYTGTLSRDNQTIAGSYSQGAPTASGTFNIARRSAQVSCHWPLRASTTFDVDALSDVTAVSMAMDAAGNPVLAWSEESTATGAWRAHVYAARQTASGITRLGSAVDITTTGQARYPAIGVSPTDGTIYVAWSESESTNTAKLYVKTYNASTNTWSLLGTGQLNSAAQIGLPRLVVDPLGRPVVTWWEYDTTNSLTPLTSYVRRWVSNSWQDVGQLIPTNSQGSVEDIAIDPPTGEPVVLWKDDFGDAFVSRWDGSAWQGQGVGSNTLNSVSSPPPAPGTMRLAVRSDGAPIATWQQQSVGSTYSTVAQWDTAKSAWSAYTTLNAGGNQFGPEIAVASDQQPVVAYRSSDTGTVYVKKWDGNGWRQMGGDVRPNLHYSFGTALRLAAGDQPIVALRHQSTNNAVQADLYLLNWDR